MEKEYRQPPNHEDRPPENMFGGALVPRDAPISTVKWVWRAATYGLALFAGLGMAASRIREKFYDAIKQSETVSPLRLGPGDEVLATKMWPENVIDNPPSVKEFGSHPILNRIAAQAASEAAESRDVSSWQKFWRIAKARWKVDSEYSQEINKVILKDCGIVSGFSPWKLTKGTFQRFIWIGWNNRRQAMTAGAATSLGVVGILSLFRENSWLWNKLHELSRDSIEDRAQLARLEEHSLPSIQADRSEGNYESVPRHHIQATGIEHLAPVAADLAMATRG